MYMPRPDAVRGLKRKEKNLLTGAGNSAFAAPRSTWATTSTAGCTTITATDLISGNNTCSKNLAWTLNAASGIRSTWHEGNQEGGQEENLAKVDGTFHFL